MLLQTTETSLIVLVTLIVVVMLAGPCNGYLDDCDGYFSPCFCADRWIWCQNIPAVTVKDAFSGIKPSYVYVFYLILSDTEDDNTLMADLIGNVTLQTIDINCLGWPTSPLVIDANAFRSTKSVTRDLYIKGCDFSQLNLAFMANFTNLQYLTLRDNSNFIASFYTLPSASLTRLTYLGIDAFTSGLNEGFLNLSLRYPEPLKQGLTGLTISSGGDLSDFALNCFLIKWITPYSKNTLEFLDISDNNLTKIPNEIRNYKNLEDVYVKSNQRPLTIQKNAFSLKKNSLLNQKLLFSDVISIQPGAFQGYYGNCYMDLSRSQLTTIDEGVFKPMLQQMVSVTEGSPLIINFENTPLDCASLKSLCKMAWLIRDNPSYLNDYRGIKEARCANGTSLLELSAMALRYPICPK